ncbi:MAG TPA: hypothetical protein VF974_00175 [Patescibacteria group bacterium]
MLTCETMNNRCYSFKIEYLFLFIAVTNFLTSCNGQTKGIDQKRKDENGHLYKNVFGEEYYATGRFLNSSGDSIETKLWFISNLTNPLVVYGNYADGLPTGDWKFGFKDGTLLSSQWAQYKNGVTKCSFSLPFQYNETVIDSNYFRLRTMNDSLGKISIIVGVSDTIIKNEELAQYGVNSENGIRRQGFSFKGDTREIVKGRNRYFFTEYFMKDSTNKDVKLFHLYGYTPLHDHFVDFVLFHDGPKDDLVKIMYNLIVTSLYIGNERFFNPHLN